MIISYESDQPDIVIDSCDAKSNVGGDEYTNDLQKRIYIYIYMSESVCYSVSMVIVVDN